MDKIILTMHKIYYDEILEISNKARLIVIYSGICSIYAKPSVYYNVNYNFYSNPFGLWNRAVFIASKQCGYIAFTDNRVRILTDKKIMWYYHYL
ncbi:hypothetical protein EST35_0451 [Pseudomonas phage vB_PaeM_PA5oct]|uniref:Uncharacterized protein n=1 Tax=Pseudomonas phage vB_PaeM_PA5oct TaxID=2163605 RepID=A0A4Y5JVC2_9CAUD|nr:hypothetical protein PQE65_gp046 [Pseudomonas phage vB_PaeM_PA5oct]QCG76319.1 hypothetical protein EST35_0451 [Pseudomonas phage vB_PaeM_PA5oct]